MATKKGEDQKPVDTTKIQDLLVGGPLSNRELRKVLGLTTDRYDPGLDRKLQQMRKAGKIHLVGSRWALSTIGTCPTCEGRGWVETRSKPSEPAPPADAT